MSRRAELLKATGGWMPLVGKRASILDENIYVDVSVVEEARGGKLLVKFDEGATLIVKSDQLEKPLAADVNERFIYFRDLTTMVLDKQVRSLFVTGEGGIGKTFTVNEVIGLEGLRSYDDIPPETPDEEIPDAYDVVMVKGYTTPRALFDTLREHKDKRVVMDDCDSALREVNSLNIIKAAVDTYDRRIVQWRTAREQAHFEFTGSLIFLSNMHKDDVSQAVLSRSIVVDLHMTKEEKIDRMGYLLPSLDCVKLETKERFDVLRMIDKYKHTVNDLNLRTLIKALIVYETSKSMDLVKYQILNG